MLVDPLRAIKVVRANPKFPDPALDLEKMGDKIAEYRKTRDPSLLMFRDGVEPTWFHIGEIPISYVNGVLRNPMFHSVKREQIAFQVGCAIVEAPTGPLAPLAKDCVDLDGASLAGEEWVERIGRKYGNITVLEMGRLAFERAELPEGVSVFTCPVG